MALKLIKTKNAAFVVDEVQDDVREKMGIFYLAEPSISMPKECQLLQIPKA